MASPLEYLFLMMMTAQPDPSAAVSNIEPSSGTPPTHESFVLRDDGKISMRTILMEPRDIMAEKLEAPVKVPPEWLPSFKIGMPLTITIDENNKVYDAKVVRIESITDETGSSIQVIAALDKPPVELAPGMVGTALVTSIPD